ncbi:MAG: hypothetical protein J4F29_17725 [Candidatus Latescibacteria bacterium]|nr:hypothetical protein [Candidatus Latescibacterota bacterium]
MQFFEVAEGVTREYQISPSDFGIAKRDYSKIPGGDSDENAEIFLSLLQYQTPEPILDMVCLNAGAAFYCFGRTDSIKEGFEGWFERNFLNMSDCPVGEKQPNV